jgi:serine/threonine-protein kinase RsbW
MNKTVDSHVELKVPVNGDYISVVRLLVSGLGARLGLPMDEIENLKLVIGEAFLSIVAKCEGAASGLINLSWKQDDAHIGVSLSDPSGRHKSVMSTSLALVKKLGGEYTSSVVDGVPHLDIGFDIRTEASRPRIFNDGDTGRA